MGLGFTTGLAMAGIVGYSALHEQSDKYSLRLIRRMEDLQRTAGKIDTSLRRIDELAAEIASLRNTTARAQTVEHMQSQMDTIQSEIAKKLSTHQAKMFE